MKQTGIKTFGDIELKDFTWKIASVRYDWTNNKAFVEVHAWETHAVHSRTFDFACTSDWSSQECYDALFTLDAFKGSSGIPYNVTVTQPLLDGLVFHSKIARNLNTAVDVYFTFEGKIYGVRFQDWNIFRTLTDEQCEEKLRKYLIDNNEIKHPAKPLEI